MFDIGWSELLLIGVVALIVVGPKDLPMMFRTLGRFTAKARSMGREFSRAMEDAARETGVKEAADDLKAMTSKKNLGLDALETAASKFEKWQPGAPSTTVKGPATQALADKKAAEAAARSAAATPEVTATKAAPKTPKKTATPKTATKTAPKTAPKTTSKAAAPKTGATKAKATGAAAPKTGSKKGEA